MTSDMSPRVVARSGGVAYLLIAVLGLFAEFVRVQVFVDGDAAATAGNLLSHELLFRASFVANLLLIPLNLVVALCLFELLRVVNRSLALLQAFIILVSSAIEGTNLLNQIAAVLALTEPATAATQGQAYLFLRLHSTGYGISLAVFGCYCLVAGYLIYRSTFLPRLLGVLLAIAGLCYLANSLTTYLAPGFAEHLLPYILVPCFIGEVSLAIWLTAAGVNVPRWTGLRAAGPTAAPPERSPEPAGSAP